jgi:hypothetical protein
MNSRPTLLYIMPRARGTVSLLSSNKLNKLDEPFNIPLVSGWDINNSPDYYHFMPYRVENEFNKIVDWDKLVYTMNSPNTCVKIHGRQLEMYRPGKIWYQSVLSSKSHNIFVLEREDRKNQLLSFLLALRHGWKKVVQDSIPLTCCTITTNELKILRRFLAESLSNYPTYGAVVTYETLPKPYFNKPDLSYMNQNSELRHEYISNLEYCKEVISDILVYYKDEWDEKIRNIKLNPE